LALDRNTYPMLRKPVNARGARAFVSTAAYEPETKKAAKTGLPSLLSIRIN
jgi:hypothetical protein